MQWEVGVYIHIYVYVYTYLLNGSLNTSRPPEPTLGNIRGIPETNHVINELSRNTVWTIGVPREVLEGSQGVPW